MILICSTFTCFQTKSKGNPFPILEDQVDRKEYSQYPPVSRPAHKNDDTKKGCRNTGNNNPVSGDIMTPETDDHAYNACDDKCKSKSKNQYRWCGKIRIEKAHSSSHRIQGAGKKPQ